MSHLLTFESVTKTFGTVRALDALSFHMPENKIVGLIGANGAGKTTALRLVIRYLMPDTGVITYRGKDIRAYANTGFPISYIPDNPVFFEELTVKEHLAFISAMYQSESEVSELISLFELDKHLNKVPSILSKGTQQKLSIVCALLRTYETLVADEPFTGLDPKQIKVLKEVFVQQREKGKTVLLSTHLLNMIDNICDYYVMIDNGKLLGQGLLAEVTNSSGCSSLEELYLYLSKTDEQLETEQDVDDEIE